MRRELRQAISNAVAGATNATTTNTPITPGRAQDVIGAAAAGVATNLAPGALAPTAAPALTAATNSAPATAPLVSGAATNRAIRTVPQRAQPTTVAIPGGTRTATNAPPPPGIRPFPGTPVAGANTNAPMPIPLTSLPNVATNASGLPDPDQVIPSGMLQARNMPLDQFLLMYQLI